MSNHNRLAATITKSPFLWGILGSAGFYAMVHSAPPNVEFVKLLKRYFANHPVEYMETVMFAIALAALIIKACDVFSQRAGLKNSLLGEADPDSHPSEECESLLAKLNRLPGRRHGEFLVCRLRAALEHVRHRGSADDLDDELKYLSDLDAARRQAGYGLFRVIVWAIPILGFLGTVIGITMALNSVDLQSPDQSMLQVLNGLGLKFDTTALALTLSMVLMFIHFYVDRAEESLFEQVDRRAMEELCGRFAATPAGGDGQLAAIHRLTESMRQTTELLMRRQAEVWQTAVESAAKSWSEMAKSASEQVRTAMTAATGELSHRAEVLERAVSAAGEVARLEDALNHNLAALAGAKHFEQTVLSLAAAVNMLSARGSETPNAAPPIKLDSPRRSSHVA